MNGDQTPQSVSFMATNDRPNVRRALNYLSNPVMIADKDLIIRYVNRAATQMFRQIEGDLRKDLPRFDINKIIGQPMDVFHKNPARQQKMMMHLREPLNGAFRIGGRELAFLASPVLNENKELVEVFVEWRDQTELKHAQRQTSQLLNSVEGVANEHLKGMTKARIDTSGLDPEYERLGARINDMASYHINVKDSILTSVQAFAEGNFHGSFPTFEGDDKAVSEAMASVQTAFVGVTEEIADLAAAIVRGDLSAEVNSSHYTGAYKKIIDDFGQAFESLNGTIHEIQTQVAEINSDISEVTRSANTLHGNAQAQSTAVEEISATVEETDSMVQANATATRGSSKRVDAALASISLGQERIVEMVSAMDDIKRSSDDISRIIKTIDDIAFQTNLLALNAAVEAARAGNHGRGFAVVAQEVRNLAGRSAKAARETSQMIEDSATRVQLGSELAQQTRESFESISENVNEIGAETKRIAASSEEQSRSTAQVNIALTELSKSTLSNSNQVEELASAAERMEVGTGTVREMVERFQLRKVKAKPKGPDLSNASPEMLAQIQAYLARQ
ncbi:MAG: methyl-accepting chemotaxis protein [Pseudomonadota bacterium]|nr:methyl-accepting chemotaxis protein [Pseudomonadota bacterium]